MKLIGLVQFWGLLEVAIWLFGLIVVLNGRKICIEKMMGFRGDVVRFF